MVDEAHLYNQNDSADLWHLMFSFCHLSNKMYTILIYSVKNDCIHKCYRDLIPVRFLLRMKHIPLQETDEKLEMIKTTTLLSNT